MFLICDWLISFAVIWYDGARHFLLSYICVCHIRVCAIIDSFSFPYLCTGKKKKKEKPLLRSNPVNAKIRLWAVAYCTATICVRESRRGVIRRIKRGNNDRISEKIMADKKLNAFRGGKGSSSWIRSDRTSTHTHRLMKYWLINIETYSECSSVSDLCNAGNNMWIHKPKKDGYHYVVGLIWRFSQVFHRGLAAGLNHRYQPLTRLSRTQYEQESQSNSWCSSIICFLW